MKRNKNKNFVYFAHPYARRDSVGEKRIIKILKELGYIVINPFDGEKEFLEKHGHSDPEYYYKDPKKPMASKLWGKDYDQVEKCPTLVAWLPVTGTGTSKEIAWATACVKMLKMKKRIIVISRFKHPSSAWEEEHAGVELYASINDFEKGKKYEW